MLRFIYSRKAVGATTVVFAVGVWQDEEWVVGCISNRRFYGMRCAPSEPRRYSEAIFVSLAPGAGCTPSSVTPVTESSLRTFIDVANSWPPPKPRATSYTTADLPGTLLTLWRVFSTAERLTVPSTARVALAKSAQVPHSAESLLRRGQ